jgi:hypothetical protein
MPDGLAASGARRSFAPPVRRASLVFVGDMEVDFTERLPCVLEESFHSQHATG